jgi:hypothetical protein
MTESSAGNFLAAVSQMEADAEEERARAPEPPEVAEANEQGQEGQRVLLGGEDAISASGQGRLRNRRTDCVRS